MKTLQTELMMVEQHIGCKLYRFMPSKKTVYRVCVLPVSMYRHEHEYFCVLTTLCSTAISYETKQAYQ